MISWIKLRNGITCALMHRTILYKAYIQEGYEMFEEMQARIAREVVFFALKVQVERKVKTNMELYEIKQGVNTHQAKLARLVSHFDLAEKKT